MFKNSLIPYSVVKTFPRALQIINETNLRPLNICKTLTWLGLLGWNLRTNKGIMDKLCSQRGEFLWTDRRKLIASVTIWR